MPFFGFLFWCLPSGRNTVLPLTSSSGRPYSGGLYRVARKGTLSGTAPHSKSCQLAYHNRKNMQGLADRVPALTYFHIKGPNAWHSRGAMSVVLVFTTIVAVLGVAAVHRSYRGLSEPSACFLVRKSIKSRFTSSAFNTPCLRA